MGDGKIFALQERIEELKHLHYLHSQCIWDANQLRQLPTSGVSVTIVCGTRRK